MEEEKEEHGGEERAIDSYVIGSLPTVIYVPDFITESEQSQLLHNIYDVPASRWKTLKNRKLQNLGGVVHEKGLLPQPLPPWLTKLTQRIRQHTGLFPSPINHVLINEYLPDQGIMPHQDGPAYFPVVAILSLQSPLLINFTPHPKLKESMTSENNEGSTVSEVVNVQTDDHQLFSVLLMPCSLLIFKDQAYTDYLHGIQDSEYHSLDKVINTSEVAKLKITDIASGQTNTLHRVSTRVSLTCRLVLKVHKNLFKF